MYESPITIESQVVTRFREVLEAEVLEAMIEYGASIKKEELLRALKYDRDQYQKGYADRDKEIVRCRECVHFDEGWCGYGDTPFDDDGFCSYGVRKDGDG